MTGAAVMARTREGGGSSRTAKYQNMKGRFTYSDKEIKAGLKLAASKVEGVLTSYDYSIIAKEHSLPSLPTIFDRFDTWNNALTVAKLKTNPSRRDYYKRTSEAVMLAAIRECADDIGDLPSLTDYDKWRKDHTGAPSSVLIRKRLGGWLKAMEMMEHV